MQALGQLPNDPEHERQWLAHVAIIAAYREQFTVKTSDPSHPLGPCAESGTPAHKPYRHAAESVLAARHLAGLDTPARMSTLDVQARAQVATDIYRVLSEADRAVIAQNMAKKLRHPWPSATTPDLDAATQFLHAIVLTNTLAENGYMSTTAAGPQAAPLTAEASDFPRHRPDPARRATPERVQVAATVVQRQKPLSRPDRPVPAGHRHRL
jgi:hypothetical protein